MTYLCETCRHCESLRVPHRFDTAGTEASDKRAYVACSASRKHGWTKLAAISTCFDYEKRKGA